MDTMEKRSAKATRQHYKKDRRETVVQVRMNEEELTLLDAKRGSPSRSNFLRGALHDKRNITETTRVEMPQLDSVVMELNRIGVNVNQMARVLNSQLAKRRMNSVSQMMEYRSLKNDIAMLDECKANIEKMRATMDDLREEMQPRDALSMVDDLQLDDIHLEEVMLDVDD